MEVRVGLTGARGCAFEPLGPERTLVRGMAIGLDFHWQRRIDVVLPGRIEIPEDPLLPPVNVVDIETYLKCVISSEMSADAPLEFLKAHAIISRSWLLNKILHHRDDYARISVKATNLDSPPCTKPNLRPNPDEGKVRTNRMVITWEDTEDHEGFDVCADDHCQRYQGLGDINDTVATAVEETHGLVLMAPDGSIADARFSKCCGGVTERFATAWQYRNPSYLQPVECPYCDLSDLPEPLRKRIVSTVLKGYDREAGNLHDWEVIVSKEDIKKQLKEKFNMEVGEVLGIEPLERGASGRISRLLVTGTEGTALIGKELMIRRLLSPTHLYSSAFDVEETNEGDSLIIKGRGWGHGVGLCQIGAARMAIEGADAEQILAHYYPGTTLQSAALEKIPRPFTKTSFMKGR